MAGEAHFKYTLLDPEIHTSWSPIPWFTGGFYDLNKKPFITIDNKTPFRRSNVFSLNSVPFLLTSRSFQ